MTVTIITDGSADNRKRDGGWAAIVRTPSTLTELTGWADDTTSNRMELTAALEGLKYVKVPSQITVIADSTYLLKTMRRKWYVNWIEQEKQGKVRPNMDLWYPLIGLDQFHDIHWVKIKGHSGDYWNERADRLADMARRNQRVLEHHAGSFVEGVRCDSFSEGVQQCKLHSDHSGNHYYTNSRANGVMPYGTIV